MSKETNVYEKKPVYMKRDLCIGKETYVYEQRPIKYAFAVPCSSTDVCSMCHKRPTYMERALCV